MGRLGTTDPGVALEPDDDIFLDGLEDIDPDMIINIDMDAELGDVHPDVTLKNQSPKNTRRRLEDKLEDLRLKRQITDFSFNLH